MASIKTLSLHLHLPRTLNPNASQHSLTPNKLKPVTLSIQKHPIHSQSITAHFSQTPISCLPSNNKFLQSLKEKGIIFLVGSFIFFTGFGFNAKPSLASLPTEMSESGERSEETNSEEEMMYERLLETEPRNVEALKMVVNEKMGKGKADEAVEYVERLIDIQPNEVEWRLLQALCYELMGHLSKAKRLFKDILKKRPLLLRALHVCLFLYFDILVLFKFQSCLLSKFSNCLIKVYGWSLV